MTGETAVLYVRIPVSVKDRIERYAEAHCLTLARAATSLLAAGLHSVTLDSQVKACAVCGIIHPGAVGPEGIGR